MADYNLVWMYGKACLGVAEVRTLTGYRYWRDVPATERKRVCEEIKERVTEVHKDAPLARFILMVQSARACLDRRKYTGGRPYSQIPPSEWQKVIDGCVQKQLESKKSILADVVSGYTYESGYFKISHYHVAVPTPYTGALPETPQTPGVLGTAYKEWK